MSKPATQRPSKRTLEAGVTGLHLSHAAFNHPARFNVGAALSVVLTLLWLTGCGPGTGGTGVGPVTSAASASMAYNGTTTVISSPAVTGLPSVPSPGLPGLPGSVTTGVDCTASCLTSVVTLKLEPEGVQLQGSCFNFTSYAPLTPAASTLTVVPGAYQKFITLSGQTVASSIPANLFLQFASGQSDSTGVSLSVRDTADVVLFGPVTLQRSDTASVTLPTTAGPVSMCP